MPAFSHFTGLRCGPFAGLPKSKPRRDPLIWREFAAHSDGFVPAVRRQWHFVGTSRGQKCRMQVELIRELIAGRYAVQCVFAMNALYCPDDANLDDLEPINEYRKANQ